MIWRAKTHPLELIATIMAPALFAAACGWSAWTILGSLIAGAAALIAAAVVGLLVIRYAVPSSTAAALFEMQSLTLSDDEQSVAFAACDELLLDDILLPDTLWLDDPLVTPPEQSRVVRLFAVEAATPGELVERIGDYLGDKRAAASLAGPPSQSTPDASQDLYAALANIRASLR